MSVSRRALRTGLAAMALACLCVCQAQAADEKPAGQPKIKFAEVEHDFGKASTNSDLRHSFTFKNIGTGLLVIESVKAG